MEAVARAPAAARTDDPQLLAQRQWLREMRPWLAVIAGGAAALSYRAGLNPPGGFWRADEPGRHAAGDPIVRSKSLSSYAVFNICNRAVLLSAVLAVLLLSSERLHRTRAGMKALKLAALLGVAAYVAAFAVGSSILVGPLEACFYLISAGLVIIAIYATAVYVVPMPS
jgi:hypothetical protein